MSAILPGDYFTQLRRPTQDMAYMGGVNSVCVVFRFILGGMLVYSQSSGRTPILQHHNECNNNCIAASNYCSFRQSSVLVRLGIEMQRLHTK